MKKQIMRILTVVLIFCLSIVPISQVSAAMPEEIMPMYNNVNSAITNMSISDSGLMTISYKYNGYSSVTTRGVVTTYIEKRTLGLFWTRVNNGQPNNEWVDTIEYYKYVGTRNYKLSSTGTYRVTVKYEIYGTGGSADVIDYQAQDTY